MAILEIIHNEFRFLGDLKEKIQITLSKVSLPTGVNEYRLKFGQLELEFNDFEHCLRVYKELKYLALMPFPECEVLNTADFKGGK